MDNHQAELAHAVVEKGNLFSNTISNTITILL